MSKATLYSTGCPRCRVLKQQLDDAHIDYDVVSDEEEIAKTGISTIPILKVENKYMRLPEAIQWIRENKED